MSIIIPSIQDVKAANLPSGTIRSGGQLADLVYPDLHRGCVLAMPFSLGATGNTSLDVSGYNNNGTLTNGPTWRGRDGLSFDGTNDYATLGAPQFASSEHFSKTLWFRRTGTVSANAGVINQQERSHFGIAGPIGVVDASQHEIYTAIFDGNVDGLGNSGIVASLGHWYCCVLSYDGSNARMYVDGELAVTKSGTLESQSGKAHVLGAVNASLYFAPVAVDEFSVYHRALTATEASQLYTVGRPGVTGGIYQARTRPNVFAFASAGGFGYWFPDSQMVGGFSA